MLSSKKLLYLGYSVLSLSLGLFLLWLIINQTPVSADQILTNIKILNPFYTLLVVVSIFLYLWLAAYKWQSITHELTPDRKQSQKFYLSYITLGSLIGQFMPQQLSLISIQSLAIRIHKINTLSKGFFTVIYDQFFNFLIPLLLLPSAILFIIGYISLPIAFFASLSTLFIAHYVIRRWHKSLIVLAIKGYCIAQRRIFRNKKYAELEQHAANIPVFGTRFTISLFWLALIRYIFLVLQRLLVLLAAGLNIKLWAILFATPLVYLAMLLSITPGNLGVMEWSWIGVLGLLHVPTVDSASFALMQRILTLLSIVFIALCFVANFAIERFSRIKKIKNEIKNKKTWG